MEFSGGTGLHKVPHGRFLVLDRREEDLVLAQTPLFGEFGHQGPDSFGGPLQNVPGADGFVDNPYIIDADSQDNYPMKGMVTSSFTPPIWVESEPVPEPEAVVPVEDPVPATVDEPHQAINIPEPIHTAEEALPEPVVAQEESELPVTAPMSPEPVTAPEEIVVQTTATTGSAGGNLAWLAALIALTALAGIALSLRKRK